ARLFEHVGALERLLGHYQQSLDAFESAVAIRLARSEFDAAALLASSALGQRYNLGDHSALGHAERFLADHGDTLGDTARNHLLVTAARVASALYDIRSAERFLDAVNDPANLPTSVRFNFLIVQLMRHSFSANAEAWKRTSHEVSGFLHELTPEAMVGIESARALTGIYLGENQTVERAIDHATALERTWGFRGPRLYNTAVETAYLYQRGRLDEARAHAQDIAANLDVSPALWVAAPVVVHLAAATGDLSLWGRFGNELVRTARNKLNDPDCLLLLAAHAALLSVTGAEEEARRDMRLAVEALRYATPEAMYVLIDAASILPERETGRIAALAKESAKNNNAVTVAVEAFVSATISLRFGEPAASREDALRAATAFDAFGWTLLEARARVVAGDVVRARELFALCGATGFLRRLPAGETLQAGLPPLSARENQIAILVARGLTNTQIAKDLNIANKTVEKHLSSVFEKLRLRSRSQVAAYVARGPADGSL
ncbi:MAG: helix-turn-helix transcriptional regulator, partial [Candidatus Eremiobacteraeota bacterium]|nr:helix-turn-helix transcriptional regulator [Candidatus Eremiobacteraeota bacterium]